MISYLFGAIYPIEELLAFCREHDIIVVEDIAESYMGNKYIGHKDSAMALFSFGSIKRYTAFGGAISFVRNKAIYSKMKAIHDTYKTQKRREYFQKILKVGAMGLLLNNQFANFNVKRVSNLVGFNYKEFVVKSLRGFKLQGDFLKKFRKQPPTALLSFMYYRLSRFNSAKFKATNEKLQKAVDKLRSQGIKVPGSEISGRSFWLFPVIVPELKACSDMLNKRGVDAYLGATQLKPVHPNFGYKKPSKMYSFFDKVTISSLINTFQRFSTCQ